MAVIVNNKIVEDTPTSFEDILDGDYMVAVGDVQAATQAQYAVLAAAIAYGGGEDDIQPGLDYFRPKLLSREDLIWENSHRHVSKKEKWE